MDAQPSRPPFRQRCQIVASEVDDRPLHAIGCPQCQNRRCRRKRRRALTYQKRDRRRIERSADERLRNALGDNFTGVGEQQAQNGYEGTTRFGTIVSQQTISQGQQRRRKLTLRDDLRTLDAAMFIGQQLDRMTDVEHRLVLTSTAFMLSDDLIANDDPYPLLEEFEYRIAMCPLRRNRVAVGITDRFSELVDVGNPADARGRKCRRKRPQLGPFASEAFTDGFMMDRRFPRLIASTEVFEREVELFEALALGDRAEHVVLDKAVGALDAAFLVAFGGRCELHFERQPTTEGAERRVLFAISAA